MDDTAAVSVTGYGVDVALRRADGLEKELLALVRDMPGVGVLDVGCGAGGSAARLSAAGAQVTGIDQYDFKTDFESLVPDGRFMQADFRNIRDVVRGGIGDEQFDFALCLRALHYVPYSDALTVLQTLKTVTKQKLFLSLSGLDSDLGAMYPVCAAPISERFEKLSPAGQETFGIHESLCLYTKAEAGELVQAAGFEIEQIIQTAFGNVGIVAV